MSPRAWDTKAKIKHRTSLNQARNSGQTAVSLYPNTLKINPIKWDTTDSIFMSIERRIERNNISYDWSNPVVAYQRKPNPCQRNQNH